MNKEGGPTSAASILAFYCMHIQNGKKLGRREVGTAEAGRQSSRESEAHAEPASAGSTRGRCHAHKMAEAGLKQSGSRMDR